jgi:thioredoxin reductase
MDDVIIVGGSFAGLAGALQLGRARRKVTVLDTGQNRNRFARHSHGLLGHDHRLPADILADARRQLERYPTIRFVNARAEDASGAPDDFSVTTDGGEVLRGRRLLLTYGVADQMPTDIDGFAQCWGQSIVPCPYCDGFEVKGQHWGLLWSGPHSQHAPGLYHDWTDRVTVFADGHDLSEDARAEMARRQVPVIDGKVVAIEHDGSRLTGIRLADGRVETVDVLFAHPRNQPSARLHERLGLELVDNPLGQTLKVDASHQTSREGIFAAGDLANPMASVTLATSSGAMAAIHAQRSMLV